MSFWTNELNRLGFSANDSAHKSVSRLVVDNKRYASNIQQINNQICDAVKSVLNKSENRFVITL